MAFVRRRLLAVLPLLLAAAAPEAPAWRLETVDGAGLALTGPGVRRPLLLPEGARLAAALPLGGTRLAQVRLGAGSRLEIVVLAAALDGAAVLVGIEPLAWRAADGSRMTTVLAAAGDRRHLVLGREAALRRGATLWAREAWTDYLVWDGGELRDAPVRAPLPGTRQAALAGWRRQAAALVAGAPAALTAGLLVAAGLTADGFAL